ncbi:MAG: M3 family metallopeptidase [Deltaproteobacteria bacterium]|nr:M3 family metallopeptidase [Deltaproteobacteria bacterium]
MPETKNSENNPLLDPADLPGFARIQAAHVVPAVEALVKKLAEDFLAFEGELGKSEGTWASVMEKINDVTDPLGKAWGIASHLKGVQESEELRAAYEEVQPQVITEFMKIGQSKKLYDAMKALLDGGGLDAAQVRILKKSILSAELSGVSLEGAEKERFNEVQQELSRLATSFSNHVLDATKSFFLHISDADDVNGMPATWLAGAAAAAKAKEKEGWGVTLDYPNYGPFLMHSKNRAQREQVYKAFVTRASSGELDNAPLLDDILRLRKEKGVLLGRANYVELSLEQKMAGSAEEIEALLSSLVVKGKPAAERDLADLKALADEGIAGAPKGDDVKHWDMSFLAERLREKRYSITDEEVRPYFPLERVLAGLFSLTKRLFNVDVKAADGEAEVWNDDVRFFKIFNDEGNHIASFFLDPFARPENKRGGAWMDECVVRHKKEGKLHVPVAYLVCNQTPPTNDLPSLMSFGEVETLFHEFGHGLQHMLTTVDYSDAAGINGVEWDAVELPSQFMENWCYHRPTLLGMSGHFESGETLPVEMFDKLYAARTFRAGSMTVRQVHFARVDLALHKSYVPGEGETAFDLDRSIAEDTLVVQPLDEDRFLCGFSHIFAGGYAAGYYSYKWAEVLSADAFSAFEPFLEGAEQESADDVTKTGLRFRDTVLAKGGSEAPMDVFVEFRGRKPNTEALLRHNGLT